jgi:hypothetical protein
MNQTCKTCRWWDIFSADGKEGFCRAHPPTVVPNQEVGDFKPVSFTEWPQTNSDDFCGEWQPLPIEPARTE